MTPRAGGHGVLSVCGPCLVLPKLARRGRRHHHDVWSGNEMRGYHVVQLRPHGNGPIEVEVIVVRSKPLGYDLILGMNGIAALGGVMVTGGRCVRFGLDDPGVCAAAEAGISIREKDFTATYCPSTRSWTAAWKWSDAGEPGVLRNTRIREKIRQGEMDISDKSHEAAVTKMKRRQWLPIGVDVRIEIDYYFGFVTGRMRRRATGGPVALEALFGWVARGRASPRWTAEVGTFLANSEKSADVSWRKTGRIDAVKIVPEKDVPEGNKEALEKREETSMSGVEKSQVSLPRCSGQRGLPNVVKRTSRQLAGERGMKKAQNGPHGYRIWGESPSRQSELASTRDDAADPRHSTIKRNAAWVWQTSVHRQRSVSRHQSAKGKHGDAERTEGELHWTEVTRKPLVKEVNTDTPVSTGHPAVPPGRHVWTETRICHRHWGTLPTEEAQGSRWRAAEAQKAQLAELPSRNERPPYTKTPTSGEGLVLPSVVDGHMVASLESEASPRHAATALEEDRRRAHRDPGAVVTPSTGSEEVDGMCRCTPGKPGEVSDVTWPRAGAQKSRVRQEQNPRNANQIAIWASGGSESGSAPEIASAPAASELPIGGSRRVDCGAADPGPIYRARMRAARHNTCLQYWLSVLPVFQRDELGSVDEPSRSATEGRSSEGLIRTVVKGIRITVRDNGNSSGKRGGRAGSNRTDDTDAEMNLQFDTGGSSFNNDRGSNPVEARNEPARESGSLHRVCYDGPVWDDARLRHGDVTGVLVLECRPSTVGGSVAAMGSGNGVDKSLDLRLIPEFDGSPQQSVVELLEKVELVCKLRDISDVASVIPLRLTGGAFAAYLQLNAQERSSIDKVKEALLAAFAADTFVAYDQFVSRKLIPDESPDVFLAELRRLATLFGGVSEKPLACAFVAGLPENGPGERSPTAPPGQRCFECGGPNHFARDCLARRQDGDPEKRAWDRGISASLLSPRPLTEALPAVRMNVGGIRRRVLVDTECSVCVAHASCCRSCDSGLIEATRLRPHTGHERYSSARRRDGDRRTMCAVWTGRPGSLRGRRSRDQYP
ncbi:hypothetical protein T02_1604 [Trichinella nativa]|uniref:CCHC-type domain-containing protein n=1 Tax=Trichinella nativa TaxID=6335 RepID=A0A0V1KRV4_9BILA|nr:hypothetical protein T02_1604 [Trichinella nativa]